MRFKILLSAAVVVALTLALLPSASPLRAATSNIGQFFASCTFFSVDVAVSGSFNDGTNADKFRYLITDGNGKKLYLENAVRSIGVTTSSSVMNLSYDADGVVDGPATKNPITFAVVELDALGNQVATLNQVTYNASCLPPSGLPVNRAGFFAPPKNVIGIMNTDTQLYTAPNSGPLGLTAKAGAQHQVIYRTADGSWVAIWIAGENILFIPANTISADLSKVPTLPGRIDGNNLMSAATFTSQNATEAATVIGGNVPTFTPTPTPTPVPGQTAPVNSPTGITGKALGNLRLRREPKLGNNIIVTIPRYTVVAVIGRNKQRSWVKVDFNGTVGWVSAFWLRYAGGKVSQLPVVE